MTQRALVVFLGRELVHGRALFIRWMKTGFVHCFLLLECDDKWIKIEGKYGVVEITYLGLITSVAEHYREQGATVIETFTQTRSIIFPVVARSCVGLTKSILGIRSWAMTPFGLYRHLTRGI